MLQRYETVVGSRPNEMSFAQKVLLALQLPPLAVQEHAILFLFAASSSPEYQPPQRPTSAPGSVETFLMQPVCAF